MVRFLVAENLPRSLAPFLTGRGLAAEDVRDLGFRGHPDAEIFAFAMRVPYILLTGDLGFANLLRFANGSPGLVITRLPDEWSTAEVNRHIGRVLEEIPADDFSGNLIVIEPDRVRKRPARF